MENSKPYPTPLLAGGKIIIAGAGLAGLSFALALRKQWPTIPPNPDGSPSQSFPVPKIVIYERHSAPLPTDHEGYSLSIRSDPLSGGMQALRSMGLLEPLLHASLSIPKPTSNTDPSSDGGFAIWDKNFNEILKLKAKRSDPSLLVPSVRIARKALRGVLLDALLRDDDTVIHWATSCTGAMELQQESSDDRYSSGSGRVQIQIQLSNGAHDTCDLLIAADGANSALRCSLRPHDKRLFAGVVCISGHATFPSASPDDNSSSVPAPLNRDWGTVIGIGGGGTSLFASPVTAHSAIWSLSYLAPEPRERLKAPLPREQAERLRDEALVRGSDIGEPFGMLVRASDPVTLGIMNVRDKMPFAHVGAASRGGWGSWRGAGDKVVGQQQQGSGKSGSCTRVIFIGDANHAMSPFAGNGANMALMDGWDLAEQLCECRDLEEALRRYDAKSMPRSKRAIRVSHWSIEMAHASGWRLWVYVLLLRVLRVFLFRRN